MIVSLNEIEGLSYKAARGAGMSWGLAEEAAFATRWLAVRDANWSGSLIALLERQGDTAAPALRELLAGQGVPVPDRLSAPEAVARAGLDRLPCGPVHNFGQDDAIAGYAPTSPAQRRERVLFIDEMSKAIFAERE